MLSVDCTDPRGLKEARRGSEDVLEEGPQNVLLDLRYETGVKDNLSSFD